jgi:hypothetical protein
MLRLQQQQRLRRQEGVTLVVKMIRWCQSRLHQVAMQPLLLPLPSSSSSSNSSVCLQERPAHFLLLPTQQQRRRRLVVAAAPRLPQCRLTQLNRSSSSSSRLLAATAAARRLPSWRHPLLPNMRRLRQQ